MVHQVPVRYLNLPNLLTARRLTTTLNIRLHRRMGLALEDLIYTLSFPEDPLILFATTTADLPSLEAGT